MRSGIVIQINDTTDQRPRSVLPDLCFKVCYGDLVMFHIYFGIMWQEFDKKVLMIFEEKGEHNLLGTGLRSRLLWQRLRYVLSLHAFSMRFRTMIGENGFIPSNNMQKNWVTFFEILQMFLAHMQMVNLLPCYSVFYIPLLCWSLSTLSLPFQNWTDHSLTWLLDSVYSAYTFTIQWQYWGNFFNCKKNE